MTHLYTKIEYSWCTLPTYAYMQIEKVSRRNFQENRENFRRLKVTKIFFANENLTEDFLPTNILYQRIFYSNKLA